MARKRDLTAAAQSATAALFGDPTKPEPKPETVTVRYAEKPEPKVETVTVRNIIMTDPEPKKVTVTIPVTKTTKETTAAPSKLLLNLGEYRDYVSVMAGLSGISMTKYIQNLIREDAEANAATYKTAKSLRK